MEETTPEAPIPEQTPAETPQPAPEVLEPAVVPETAHMGRNEPLSPEPEPFQPAPAPVIQQTGILHAVRDILSKARNTIQFRKRAKLATILLALEKKNSITNDEVQKLLRVSDATATRYLSTLEKEGK